MIPAGSSEDAVPAAWTDALVGRWDMKIDWRGRRRFIGWRHGTVQADVYIFADGPSFGMEVNSEGSDSRTRIASWTRSTPGSPELHYVYDVTPRAGAPQGSHPYTRAAILRYYPELDELRGNYWTSQMTVGVFTITRYDPAESGKRTKPDRRRRGSFWMRALGGLLLAAMVCAVLWFLVLGRPEPNSDQARTDSQRDIEFAVGQAARTCLMNLTEQDQRSIETGVTTRLQRYSAGGYATIDRTRKSVNETLSEAGQLKQQQQLSSCMIKQTDKFVEQSRSSKK